MLALLKMTDASTKPPPCCTLVVATNNPGKLAELRELLAGLPLELVRPADVGCESFHVVEDGATFEDNALLKARAAYAATGLMALADDSGLEVDALGGLPGVRSARFAGEQASDADNNALLLRELEDVDESARTARFRCALALVVPWQDAPLFTAGSCEGQLQRSPRGSGGFGYDPLFVANASAGLSLAELDDAAKNALSHRGAAVRALVPQLRALLDAQLLRLAPSATPHQP